MTRRECRRLSVGSRVLLREKVEAQEEGSWNRRKSKEVTEDRHIYVFFYSLSIYKVLVIRGIIAMIIHFLSVKDTGFESNDLFQILALLVCHFDIQVSLCARRDYICIHGLVLCSV